MKCKMCGNEMREGMEQVGLNGGVAVYNRFAYCDNCRQKVNLDALAQSTQPKKNSTLSVWACVLTIFTFTLPIAFILALVDLGTNDKTKKHVGSWFAIIVTICVAIIGVIALSNGDKKETQIVGSTVASSEKSTEKDAVASEINVEVLAEYTLPDGIGWYTRHFIVVKNNSSETVDVSTSSLAYSKDGTMVAVADGSFDALGAGCTSVLYEAFDTDADIDHYDTTLNDSKSKYYDSVIQDLSYIQNDIDGGAVFQVTNNGEKAAEFVEGYALFFKSGELVDYDSSYFTDDDFELKPGKTISKQFNAYKDFDTIEFYLTGRR